MSTQIISMTTLPAKGLEQPVTSAPPPAVTATVARPSPASVIRRAGVAVVGGAIVLLGLLLVPLPGPGWVIVFAGTTVLGQEFPWAARLSDVLQRRLQVAAQWIRRRRQPGRTTPAPAVH